MLKCFALCLLILVLTCQLILYFCYSCEKLRVMCHTNVTGENASTIKVALIGETKSVIMGTPQS